MMFGTREDRQQASRRQEAKRRRLAPLMSRAPRAAAVQAREALAAVDTGGVLSFNNNGVGQNNLTIFRDTSGNLVLQESGNDITLTGVNDLSTDPQTLMIPAGELLGIERFYSVDGGVKINGDAVSDTITVNGTGPGSAGLVIGGEANTITIHPTAAGKLTGVFGDDGDDMFAVDPRALDSILEHDSIPEHDSILGHVCVLGSAGDDDIGDDDITVSASTASELIIDGGPQLGADVPHFDAAGANVVITPTGLCADGSHPIAFSDIEALDIHHAEQLAVVGDAGNNAFSVTSTSAVDAITVGLESLQIDVQTPVLTFRGLAGNDTLTIKAAPFGLSILSRIATDSHTSGAFNGSSVTMVNGGNHADVLTQITSDSTVRLVGGAADDDIFVTNTGEDASVRLEGDIIAAEFLLATTAIGSVVEMFGEANNDTYHIDTIEPNTPLLHLGEASDSGWHDDENVTHNNTLTVTMSDHDANIALHQLLLTDYLKFPIDDRFEESDEILLCDSATDAAVDQVNTAGDGFTCLTSPDFCGVAEVNNIVTLAIDGTPAGTTFAVPLNGDAAFQSLHAPDQGVGANYLLEMNLNLADTQHAAVGTSENLAGNHDSPAPYLFLVDTQGPRVTAVEVDNVGNSCDRFDPKPSTEGPTTPVDALVISVADLPARTASLLYDAVFAATATADGNFKITGDNNGIIAIESISYTPQTVATGPRRTGLITLTFAEPLPDDRFTLTVSDSHNDVAGNALDGEANFDQPQQNRSFPSGDGVPGGNFVARFAVDSRPAVDTWSQGVAYTEINNKFVWDPQGNDTDSTNHDFVFHFGEDTDAYFAGSFSPQDAAASGLYRIDADDGQNWCLDLNGNHAIDAGEKFATDLCGVPFVGELYGERFADLATFNNASGQYQFDLARDGDVDHAITFGTLS